MALISLPGIKVNIPGLSMEEDPHITLVYLGDNVPLEDLLKTLEIVEISCMTTKSFEVNTEYTSVFSKSKKGFPVILPIDSVDIYVLRDKIVAGLNKNNIKWANNFLAYRPHMTLYYSPTVIPASPLKLSWLANQVNIWPTDKGTRGQISVPLK